MNIVGIQRAIRVEGLDGWLLYDFKGSNPLARDLLKLNSHTPRTRRWFYFIPVHGRPGKLVHRIEPDALAGLPGATRLFAGWPELKAQLGHLLRGSRSVAMEYSPGARVPAISRVDGGTLEMVRRAGVRVRSSGDLVQLCECRLSPAEAVDHKRTAALLYRFVRDAFGAARTALRLGRRTDEYALQQRIARNFKRHGLEADHDPIVAVGPHSGLPHYAPDPRGSAPLRRGGVLLIDLWAKSAGPKGIYADITWVGFLGPSVPSRVAEVFETVRRARDRAVSFLDERLKLGIRTQGWQVDRAARAVIQRAGHGNRFTHRTGHSIAREVHAAGANMDDFETHETRAVIPGTLFSIEPGIYLRDFGIRSEIDVLASERGARPTTTPLQERVVPILAPDGLP